MAMTVYALLSWYDEHPDHLTRCVRSLAGFADHLIAVDGAYAQYPNAQATSGTTQWLAIANAAVDAELLYDIHVPDHPWESEVAKRAFMFEYARQRGATPADWLLIIDGDMLVAHSEGARGALARVTEDVAVVRWHDVRPDGHLMNDLRFRSLFRALPGLTVRWTHYLYVAPGPNGLRFLWLYPSGHASEEPAADLSDCLTLHHRRLDRTGDRDAAAREYYRERDSRSLERPPHW